MSLHRIGGVLGRVLLGTVEVVGPPDRRVVQVRMGPFFRADVPVERIAAVAVGRPGLWAGVGVHGWKGNWVVNGAFADAAVLQLAPPLRVWTCSVPVKAHRLSLGVLDPGALVAELEAERRRG